MQKKEGKGAVSLDGRLIDIASIRQAEVLVQKAKLIEGDNNLVRCKTFWILKNLCLRFKRRLKN